MGKEVQMAFRVERDLREDFSQATERNHRPAAQVLREFMRAYVSQDRRQPANDAISNAERQQRQDAVGFARANVGLEGFKTTADEEEHCRRFIAGEIDLAEFVEHGPRG